VPGGSSSTPDVGATVAASKSTDFDENTAAALLLGLAQPVGDSEVPDPAGEYSIKDEDFFQNLKESDEEKESEPWGKHRGIMEQ
jgi:hypothetical protein